MSSIVRPGDQLDTTTFRHGLGKRDSNHGSHTTFHVSGRSGGAGPNVAIVVELDLSRVGDTCWESELDEGFCLRIEAVDRVVSGTTNPNDALGIHVQSIGNLVFRIGEIINGPLLGLRIKLAEHT